MRLSEMPIAWERSHDPPGNTAAGALAPKTILNDHDSEPLDRALNDLINEDQWIEDFIKRLNCTIGDMARKK